MSVQDVKPKEYERRLIHGIPVFVEKGATKTESVDIYTWNPDSPRKFGKYDYSTNGLTIDEGFTDSPEAAAAIIAWRASQIPRSRADIRGPATGGGAGGPPKPKKTKSE